MDCNTCPFKVYCHERYIRLKEHLAMKGIRLKKGIGKDICPIKGMIDKYYDEVEETINTMVNIWDL